MVAQHQKWLIKESHFFEREPKWLTNEIEWLTIDMALNPKATAAFVREVRDLCGADQETFASLIGASRRSIVRWEAGDAVPRLVPLARMVMEMHADAPELARKRAKEMGVDEVVAGFLSQDMPRDAASRAVAVAAVERVCDRALLAACDAAEVAPRKMRAALALALAEMAANGVDVEQARRVFGKT